MPRLSACIEMIFRELPFVDRIAATKSAGLDTGEFWGCRHKDLSAVRGACVEQGVRVATFGLDTGAPLVAENGMEALLQGTRDSIEAARQLEVNTLLCTTGNERQEVSREEHRRIVVRKLKAIA